MRTPWRTDPRIRLPSSKRLLKDVDADCRHKTDTTGQQQYIQQEFFPASQIDYRSVCVQPVDSAGAWVRNARSRRIVVRPQKRIREPQNGGNDDRPDFKSLPERAGAPQARRVNRIGHFLPDNCGVLNARLDSSNVFPPPNNDRMLRGVTDVVVRAAERLTPPQPYADAPRTVKWEVLD